MAPTSRAATVLIVDDEPAVRRLIVRLLAQCSPRCLVAQAGDVPRAKKLLISLRPDLAVLDLRMPNGNGLELCRLIQSHPWLSKTHVLVLTGYPSSRVRERTFAEGACEFLPKPFENHELTASLGRLLA